MNWLRPHPWDPVYALPSNIRGEPPGKLGTQTTAAMRRRTFDDPGAPVPPWEPGYALPDYIKEEPLGRGVYYTKPAPRRTIASLQPAYLGDTELENEMGGGDPIGDFGREFARWAMTRVKSVPRDKRKAAMQTLFSQLDPKLWTRAQVAAEKLTQGGVPADQALEQGIAQASSQGLVEQFAALGRGKKPSPTSFAGLGMYGGPAGHVVLSGLLDTVKRVGAGVVTGGLSEAYYNKDTIYKYGKEGLSKVTDLVCKVANHPAGALAAGAGSMAAGAPPQTGAAGAQLTAAACNAGAAQPPYGGAIPSTPAWMLPVAIGGGALLLIIALK